MKKHEATRTPSTPAMAEFLDNLREGDPHYGAQHSVVEAVEPTVQKTPDVILAETLESLHPEVREAAVEHFSGMGRPAVESTVELVDPVKSKVESMPAAEVDDIISDLELQFEGTVTATQGAGSGGGKNGKRRTARGGANPFDNHSSNKNGDVMLKTRPDNEGEAPQPPFDQDQETQEPVDVAGGAAEQQKPVLYDQDKEDPPRSKDGGKSKEKTPIEPVEEQVVVPPATTSSPSPRTTSPSPKLSESDKPVEQPKNSVNSEVDRLPLSGRRAVDTAKVEAIDPKYQEELDRVLDGRFADHGKRREAHKQMREDRKHIIKVQKEAMGEVVDKAKAEVWRNRGKLVGTRIKYQSPINRASLILDRRREVRDRALEAVDARRADGKIGRVRSRWNRLQARKNSWSEARSQIREEAKNAISAAKGTIETSKKERTRQKERYSKVSYSLRRPLTRRETLGGAGSAGWLETRRDSREDLAKSDELRKQELAKRLADLRERQQSVESRWSDQKKAEVAAARAKAKSGRKPKSR